MADVELEAAGLPSRRSVALGFSFSVSGIGALLLAGLVLRLILAFLPGFGADIGLFQFWADRLADDGPWNFYEGGFFADYTPGYLYLLWLLGEFNKVLHFSPDTYQYLLKLPPSLADLASAYLLYRLLDGHKNEVRLAAAAIYVFFPAALLVGPVWSQADSLLALALFVSVYYISKGRALEGSIAYVVAFVIKPQAIAALPFLTFWIMKQHPPRWIPLGSSGIKLPVPPRLWLYITAAGFGVLLLMILPFFPDHPWDFYYQLKHAAEFYKYNSLNAYNFWSMVREGFFFQPDNAQHYGLADQYWGLILFGVATAAVIYALRKGEGTAMLALGTALSVMAFFVFLTRMHERYLFPFFLPFLVACVLTQSRLLWGAFIVLSLVHFLDLYFVYSYYPLTFPAAGEAGTEPFVRPLYDWVDDNAFLLSLITTLAFPVLLVVGYGLSRRAPPEPEPS